MRILCLHARSQYRLMNAFLDTVAQGFVDNGHTISVASLDDLQPVGAETDLVFSFGGVGADLDLGAPVLTWLVDNPVWTPELYEMRPDRDGVLVVAGEHIAVATDFLGLEMPVGFVPHGIEIDPALPEPSFTDDERDIDVLFAASFDPRKQPPWHTDEACVANTLRATLQLADERWDHHVRELEVSALFREAADANGLPFVVAGHRLFAPQLAWLDSHLRDRRRLACVRALDKAGVSVHLVGVGGNASHICNTRLCMRRWITLRCSTSRGAPRSLRTLADRCSTTAGTSGCRWGWRTARSR